MLMAGCHSSANKNAATDLVVVKATRSGTVQRVLVNEGTNVNEGATLIEIAVPVESPATNQNQAEEQARAAISRTQRDISDAEAEVNRAAVEVQRVEPLVAAGTAPQAQLDAARSQYQQAQERLQRVRESAAQAETRAVAAAGSNSPAQPPAQLVVAVSAPASGNVRVISVRAGQRVTAGQAIATVSTASR
jgi:multidrug efflux pump subunit AcrA (membrane-fusion protein)